MPPVSYKCEWMPNLYDIIAELRRENQTPSAARTLDMVVVELGQTRDNLRLALIHLEERAVPTGGRGSGWARWSGCTRTRRRSRSAAVG